MGKFRGLLSVVLCVGAVLGGTTSFGGTPTVAPNHFADLQGVWESGCVPSTMTSLKSTVSGASITIQLKQFLEPDCKTPFTTSVQVFKLAPGARLKDTPKDAHSVDLTLVSHKLTPEVTELAKRFSVLYETKMTLGQPTEVAGRAGLPSKGQVNYTIYRVKGEQLEIGDQDAYFPAARPHKFSPIPLKKKH